jgi:hypothetical protein
MKCPFHHNERKGDEEMKSYVVLRSEWESVNVLYCGNDVQEAERILDDGKYAQDNAMETWEDGKQFGLKNGTYKEDVEG